MKSRFTYGMFAGFALACLFFFFFLFFFPDVFRNLAAKKSPNNSPVAAAPAPVPYANEYVAYQPPTAYYDYEYVANKPPTASGDVPYAAKLPPTSPETPSATSPRQPEGWGPSGWDLPLSGNPAAKPVGVPSAADLSYRQVIPNPVVHYIAPEGPPYYGRSLYPPTSV